MNTETTRETAPSPTGNPGAGNPSAAGSPGATNPGTGNPSAGNPSAAGPSATGAAAVQASIERLEAELTERTRAVTAARAKVKEARETFKATRTAADGKKIAAAGDVLELAELAEQGTAEELEAARVAKAAEERRQALAELEHKASALTLNAFREHGLAPVLSRVVQLRAELAAAEQGAGEIVSNYEGARAQLASQASTLGATPPPAIPYAKVYEATLALESGATLRATIQDAFGVAPVNGLPEREQFEALCLGADMNRVSRILRRIHTAQQTQNEIRGRLEQQVKEARQYVENAKRTRFEGEQLALAEQPVTVLEAQLAELESGAEGARPGSPRSQFATLENEIRTLRSELDQLGFGHIAPGPRAEPSVFFAAARGLN